MKNHSGAAIQFSGYPLTVAEPKKTKETHLRLIRREPNPETTSIQQNRITNDPKNWDLNWFNGYE